MKRILLSFLILLFLIVGQVLPPQFAAESSPSGVSNLNDEIERTLSVAGQNRAQDAYVRSAATMEAFDSLIAKAQASGPVRVIVGLRVGRFGPEGHLSGPQAADIQRQAIAQAQRVLMERLSGLSVDSVHNFEFIPFTAMTVDAAALQQLESSYDVMSIEEDIALGPALAESVSLIGAPAAWAAGFTGSGQTVVILDSGVDSAHSFLSGKVVSEACYSSNTAISSSVCPGGVTTSTSPGSGINCSLSITGCNHGTHVAGIASGKGTIFSGVAKDSNVIAIQVFSRFDSSTDCKTRPTPCALSFNSDQVRGLERVFALRSTYSIPAVNISIGGGRFFSNCDSSNPSYKAAIDNLRSVGIATVISSGNESFKDSMGSPACISTAISVGATGDGSGSTTLDAVASFSNSASFLSLLAPGQLINSSVPGGGFSNFQGTSMAAPHVAGAWAVIKSKKPTATVDEVFTALRDTGLSITDTNGITKSRIKLDVAINAIDGGGGCSTTPILLGQTIGGTLTTFDCRYPTGSNWYSDAYSFNGTAGQQVAISMTSSAFDTWLTLVGPNGSALVTDNDGGGGTNSRIPASSGFYTLPSSGTFIIQASSNLTNAIGTYTLNLVGPATGVPNNNFTNAQIIPGSTGSVSGNNTGATKESGEPNHAGNPGGASVWYQFQAPASGTLTITTAGSNFDTLLGVYTGSTVSGLTTIASNDDASPSDLSSRVTFSLVGGTTYRIAVDGYNGATGSILLNWISGIAGPANNNFSSAQVVSGSTGSVSGNNANASKESGEPDHAGNSGGVSVWYQWQAPISGPVNINTSGSNFDTLLGVYIGNSVSALTTIGSNDDTAFPAVLTSNVVFNAIAGTTYRIAVDGYAGATGSIVLSWNFGLPAHTGVFRPSTGGLFLKNANTSGFADINIIYGIPGDYPLAGDWNGDNVDTVGVYRNGTFFLRNSNTTGFSDIVIPFGNPGDQPVVGDWNGDGVDTIGIYRNGIFYLRNSNTPGPTDSSFVFGNPGDIGIAGDWNGDGVVSIGVFRPSNGIVYLKNSNSGGFSDISFVFGIAGDKPVAGDWNGDGIDTIGIYRNGIFYLRNSNSTGFSDISFVLGNNGDFPIAGNWNGLP